MRGICRRTATWARQRPERQDNPLHRERLEIARMGRHDFMLDVALARDRSIAGVFAGHPEQAHCTGARFVAEVLLETLDEPVDAVITTSAYQEPAVWAGP